MKKLVMPTFLAAFAMLLLLSVLGVPDWANAQGDVLTDLTEDEINSLDGKTVTFWNNSNSYGKTCLDVQQGKAQNGQNVQTWDCNGSAAQKWNLSHLSDSDFRIKSSLNNDSHCLDNRGDFENDGRIGIWKCASGGHVNQTFSIGKFGDDWVVYTEDSSNKYAMSTTRNSTGTRGDAVSKTTYSDDVSPNSLWSVDDVSPTPTPTPTATPTVSPTATNTPEPTVTPTPTPTVNSKTTTLTNEDIEWLNGRTVTIWNNAHNYGKTCLDVLRADARNGKNVQTWDCNNTAAQKWKLAHIDVGDFRFASAVGSNEEYCLDNRGDFKNDGRIGVWECISDGHVNQTFTIRKYDHLWVIYTGDDDGKYAVSTTRTTKGNRGDAESKTLDPDDVSPFSLWYISDDGSTPTPTPDPTDTPRPKPVPTNTPTPTFTPEPAETPTPTPSATGTPTPTPSATGTPTPTPSATGTPTPTPTATSTPRPSTMPLTTDEIDSLDGKTVTIWNNAHNYGKTCLDVQQGNAKNGQNVQTWDCNASNSQKWNLKHWGDDKFSLASPLNHGSFCLDNRGDLKNDGRVNLWTCQTNGHVNQKFKIGKQGTQWVIYKENGSNKYGVTTTRTSKGTRGDAKSKTLDLSDISPFSLWYIEGPPPTPTPTPTPEAVHLTMPEVWSLHQKTVTIWNDAHGYGKTCLDVQGGNASDEQNVQTWDCNDSVAQRWYMRQFRHDGTDHHFMFKSKLNNESHCLNHQGDYEDGGRIELMGCIGINGDVKQEFKVRRVGSQVVIYSFDDDGNYALSTTRTSQGTRGDAVSKTLDLSNVSPFSLWYISDFDAIGEDEPFFCEYRKPNPLLRFARSALSLLGLSFFAMEDVMEKPAL